MPGFDAVAGRFGTTEQLAAPGDGFPHTTGGEFLGEGGVFVALCALVKHVEDSGDDSDRGSSSRANVSRTSGRWAFWSAGLMTVGARSPGRSHVDGPCIADLGRSRRSGYFAHHDALGAPVWERPEG